MLFKALLDGRDALREAGENADFYVPCDKDDLRKVKYLRIGEKPIKQG
jgi:hypothetical protein